MGAMAPERYVRILSALSETEEGIEAETGLQTKGDEFCSDTALPPARSGRNRPRQSAANEASALQALYASGENPLP